MDIDTFKQIFPKASNPDTWVTCINDTFPLAELNTSNRIASFLAQCGHESAGFTILKENLNYSARALTTVFGKYFPNITIAEAYARKPEKIANRVYANRMGNGDEESGDGWKYRGRGLIQLTGKNNYQSFSYYISEPEIMNNPDLVSDKNEFALLSATWFWTVNKLNQYADKEDIKGITRVINGGYNGLSERMNLYYKIKKYFS